MLLVRAVEVPSTKPASGNQSFRRGGVGIWTAAFWLTPSFIAQSHSIGRRTPSTITFSAAGHAAGGITIDSLAAPATAGARSSRPILSVVHHAFVFRVRWIVLWYYSTGVDTIPESRRYALEMEMFLLLLVFEVFRQTLRTPITPLRFFVFYSMLAIFLAGWGQIRTYCTQGFASRRPSPVDGTIERRVAERLAALPSKWPRIRLRWSSFSAEFVVRNSPGGCSFESGLTTRMPLNLSYQIRTSVNSTAASARQDAVRELQNLGRRIRGRARPEVREPYRDFKSPHKFNGLLEVVGGRRTTPSTGSHSPRWRTW